MRRIGTPLARSISLRSSSRRRAVSASVRAAASSLARQVLVNLLANAVMFTGPADRDAGRAEPRRITVSAGTATQASPDARLDGSGSWVYVRVEDTGIGIPADSLASIFEAFVQADMMLTRALDDAEPVPSLRPGQAPRGHPAWGRGTERAIRARS